MTAQNMAAAGATSAASDRVGLGKTGIQISPLGIGTWSWGDTMYWQYGQSHGQGDVQAAFTASVDQGINFFDTAEIYGRGQSEKLLGQCIAASGQTIVVASKFMPFPWRLSRTRLLRSLRASLERLGLPRVDLYQIHWPSPPLTPETWMEAMAEAAQEGLTRAVGVSNYSAPYMRRSFAALARHNLPLASNQVEYSLLQRAPERNGVLQACREMGITLIAYSPLAMGVLSGKYTPDNPPPGMRGRKYRPAYLRRVAPLLALVRETGARYGKSSSQVALNWVICKGAVPIPGAKNARQAAENAGALGWRLADADVAALDEMSARVLAA